MYSLIATEVYKIFSKWRTYISFIAIGLIGILINIMFYFEGDHFLSGMTRNLQEQFVFVGNFLNGYLITYFILNMLLVQIPFLIALVSGDLLAGEATAGTYRILVTRPVSRFKIVLSKFIAGEIYTLAVIVSFALATLGLGLLLLGDGELIVISEKIIIFKSDDVLWRFMLAFGYSFLSMSVVTSLAFLFSSFVENSIGPIIVTMAIIIVFLILSMFEIEFIETIKPYMFTTYITDWNSVFENPADTASLLESSLVMMAHIVLFFSIAAFSFTKKDILT